MKNNKKKSSTTSVSQKHQVTTQHYSGPIPPPEFLERLEQVKPGLANRVMLMAEESNAHTIKVQQQVIHNTHQETKLQYSTIQKGQCYAFFLMMFFAIASLILIAINKTIIGTIFAGCPVVYVAINFLNPFKNKDIKKKENS